MKTEENNKLIAQFMGEDINKKGTGLYPHSIESGISRVSIPFNYHNSWNWLMPVVQKIEEEHNYFSKLECIGIGIYDFSFNQHQFQDPDELELPEGILVRTDERVSGFITAKFEAMYIAVTEYIKWYNENDK